jgi:hypothetical protein
LMFANSFSQWFDEPILWTPKKELPVGHTEHWVSLRTHGVSEE